MDIKPKIEQLDQVMRQPKLVQGLKRIHESNSSHSTEVAIRQESDLEFQSKKSKLGFAVPNWKNISQSAQPDADRYPQYPMVEIRSNCEALVATYERKLLTMPMYTISANVLCRHTKNGKDIYVPIEFGIHCYSMAGGHQGKTYHCIVDAGPIPSGSVNQTRDHMDATHKISSPVKGQYPPEARNDYSNIYKEMLKYTRGGQRTVLVPDERDMEQIRGCLEWLYEKAAYLDPMLPKVSTWTILPMVEYVAAAYNFVFQRMLHNPRPAFTMHYIIKIKQENSTWDYEERYICPYHRQPENQTRWCAKNCAARAFLAVEEILDSLAKMYSAATGTEKPNSNTTEQQQRPMPPSTVQKSLPPSADPEPVGQLTYK